MVVTRKQRRMGLGGRQPSTLTEWLAVAPWPPLAAVALFIPGIVLWGTYALRCKDHTITFFSTVAAVSPASIDMVTGIVQTTLITVATCGAFVFVLGLLLAFARAVQHHKLAPGSCCTCARPSPSSYTIYMAFNVGFNTIVFLVMMAILLLIAGAFLWLAVAYAANSSIRYGVREAERGGTTTQQLGAHALFNLTTMVDYYHAEMRAAPSCVKNSSWLNDINGTLSRMLVPRSNDTSGGNTVLCPYTCLNLGSFATLFKLGGNCICDQERLGTLLEESMTISTDAGVALGGLVLIYFACLALSMNLTAQFTYARVEYFAALEQAGEWSDRGPSSDGWDRHHRTPSDDAEGGGGGGGKGPVGGGGGGDRRGSSSGGGDAAGQKDVLLKPSRSLGRNSSSVGGKGGPAAAARQGSSSPPAAAAARARRHRRSGGGGGGAAALDLEDGAAWVGGGGDEGGDGAAAAAFGPHGGGAWPGAAQAAAAGAGAGAAVAVAAHAGPLLRRGSSPGSRGSAAPPGDAASAPPRSRRGSSSGQSQDLTGTATPGQQQGGQDFGGGGSAFAPFAGQQQQQPQPQHPAMTLPAYASRWQYMHRQHQQQQQQQQQLWTAPGDMEQQRHQGWQQQGAVGWQPQRGSSWDVDSLPGGSQQQQQQHRHHHHQQQQQQQFYTLQGLASASASAPPGGGGRSSGRAAMRELLLGQVPLARPVPVPVPGSAGDASPGVVCSPSWALSGHQQQHGPLGPVGGGNRPLHRVSHHTPTSSRDSRDSVVVHDDVPDASTTPYPDAAPPRPGGAPYSLGPAVPPHAAAWQPIMPQPAKPPLPLIAEGSSPSQTLPAPPHVVAADAPAARDLAPALLQPPPQQQQQRRRQQYNHQRLGAVDLTHLDGAWLLASPPPSSSASTGPAPSGSNGELGVGGVGVGVGVGGPAQGRRQQGDEDGRVANHKGLLPSAVAAGESPRGAVTTVQPSQVMLGRAAAPPRPQPLTIPEHSAAAAAAASAATTSSSASSSASSRPVAAGAGGASSLAAPSPPVQQLLLQAGWVPPPSQQLGGAATAPASRAATPASSGAHRPPAAFDLRHLPPPNGSHYAHAPHHHHAHHHTASGALSATDSVGALSDFAVGGGAAQPAQQYHRSTTPRYDDARSPVDQMLRSPYDRQRSGYRSSIRKGLIVYDQYKHRHARSDVASAAAAAAAAAGSGTPTVPPLGGGSSTPTPTFPLPPQQHPPAAAAAAATPVGGTGEGGASPGDAAAAAAAVDPLADLERRYRSRLPAL